MDAKQFLIELRREVEAHPGTNHLFLSRLCHVPFTREDYLIASTQHYPLVGTFTRYLEELLLRAPSSESKSWLAKVLVDEYGEGSDGKDHRTLYREYLVAAGLKNDDEMDIELHPDVPAFILEHLRICKEEPFLVGLGAVGPGHEWSIPKMFPPIIDGLRRAGFAENEIAYFTLHTLQDVDHGRWLEEALLLNATTPKAQAEIRRGAILSLEARERFWSAVQDKVTRWRQPKNAHIRPQARKDDIRHDMTLRELKQVIDVDSKKPSFSMLSAPSLTGLGLRSRFADVRSALPSFLRRAS